MTLFWTLTVFSFHYSWDEYQRIFRNGNEKVGEVKRVLKST